MFLFVYNLHFLEKLRNVSILPEFLNRDNSANVAQPNNYKGQAGGTDTLSLANVMQTQCGEKEPQ